VTAALLLLLASPATVVVWHTDFDAALKQAHAQKQRVFVYVLDSV